MASLRRSNEIFLHKKNKIWACYCCEIHIVKIEIFLIITLTLRFLTLIEDEVKNNYKNQKENYNNENYEDDDHHKNDNNYNDNYNNYKTYSHENTKGSGMAIYY
jgi:hypothetical protein